MKRIFLLLFLSISVLSCKKEKTRVDEVFNLNQYLSTNNHQLPLKPSNFGRIVSIKHDGNTLYYQTFDTITPIGAGEVFDSALIKRCKLSSAQLNIGRIQSILINGVEYSNSMKLPLASYAIEILVECPYYRSYLAVRQEFTGDDAKIRAAIGGSVGSGYLLSLETDQIKFGGSNN